MNSNKIKRWLGSGLGIAVTVLVLYFLVRKIDIGVAISALGSVSIYQAVFLMLLYLSSFILRAIRIRNMLSAEHNASFWLVLKSILVGFSGNNILPARGGELLRMEYLSKSTEISRISSATYILAEKIIDGVALLFFLALGLLLAPADVFAKSWFKDLSILAVVVFGGALFTLFVIKAFFPIIQKWLTHKTGVWLKLKEILESIFQAISFINWSRKGALVLLSGILIWFIEGLTFVIASSILELNAPAVALGFIALVVVNFGLLVPSSPGYVGVFQAMCILALSLFGLGKEISLAYGVLVHAVQFIPVTLVGMFFVIPFLLKYRFTTKKQD